MTLEDFEKSLSEGRQAEDRAHHAKERQSKHRKHHHHHHHHSKQRHRDSDAQDRHRHKRARRSPSADPSHDCEHRDTSRTVADQQGESHENETILDKETQKGNPKVADPGVGVTRALQRDSWMQMPSGNDIEFRQEGVKQSLKPIMPTSSRANFGLKIHKNELKKHHMQDVAAAEVIDEQNQDKPAQNEVDYVFGDAGSQWRMTKLKAVFRQAEESGKPVEVVALGQFGDLRAFDNAREEQIELDRRETYGSDYVGKEKPLGDLFTERKLDEGVRREPSSSGNEEDDVVITGPSIIDTQPPVSDTVTLDHTALNRLKARMMKAKLRGAAGAAALEAEYNAALASSVGNNQPDTVILGMMDNTMLAGGRIGEVKYVDSKRGRQRGLVEENEDMTIEDMVREERRTRHQAGGEGQRYAERIAKDGKYDNNLDYMDENAAKLAKRVQKSEINLRNNAISDFQKLNRILDKCPLCHREESNSPPLAPVVSLATRVYLTLPTEPEISDGGSCIVPIQHRVNLLECDDDEWEEIRNFMKSLIRMYHDQGRDVIFYENAAAPHRKKHAAMEVVPLPYSLGDSAPAFFKEAILSTDEEWTQHKKLIDTLSKAKHGLGKLAFRRTLAKEMPYFHVWFQLDGGLGHIVEDSNRWPKGDLFAREIIGGMLDRGPEVIKRQGHWSKGADSRVDGFRKRWRRFDWTRVLTDNDTTIRDALGT